MKIGWPTNVNQIIIDSTTLDLGEGTVENEMENGKIETWLKSSCVPEVINVTMDFDFFEKDENGLTEFDRFVRWFKYKHKYGTVPFEFTTIYKTGREIKNYSTYKIKGSPKFSKRGLAQRATMVWVEDFKEIIEIPTKAIIIENISVENGSLYVYLNQNPDELITSDKFSILFFKDGVTISTPELTVRTDGNLVSYNFTPFQATGSYEVRIEDKSKHFQVG